MKECKVYQIDIYEDDSVKKRIITDDNKVMELTYNKEGTLTDVRPITTQYTFDYFDEIVPQKLVDILPDGDTI